MSAASPMPSNRCGELDQVGARALLPAPDRHLVAPRVEPDRDPTGVLDAQLLDQRRSLDRGGADDDALDPGLEQLVRRVGRAHPATDLDAAGDAAHDQADLVEVGALTGAGGVEIDDVDPLRARGFELARDAHRVVVVDGLGGEVALAQADAVPAAQVDGGKEIDHDGSQSVPLVDGTPVPSIFTASRSARATPLNDASITW